MPPIKPYRSVPIRECGEALAPLPQGIFAFTEPHPYKAMGAPYDNVSPWFLRQSIVASLVNAQHDLQTQRPGWKIKFFDAYRPNAVQAFLVERELALEAKAAGLDPSQLTTTDREKLLAKIYRLFAIASDDPMTPPPHSTGAAFDCTLVDEKGDEVDMGSPIDENSDRSLPNYFINTEDSLGQIAQAHRTLLNSVLYAHGFRRNPGEWWHFSRGDQLAVWLDRDTAPDGIAIYGRAEAKA